MKKIIVTGATSMIGAALIEAGVRDGAEVYAVVRPGTKRMDRLSRSPSVHPVYGTLEQIAEIENLPKDCDIFYHLAWAGTGKAERDDPDIQARNIQYTLTAVELARRCGCRRFVGAGSQAEYGPVTERIDERTGCAPVLSYGIAKYAAGLLSRKLCQKSGLEQVWGRIFSVYGPHDSEESMISYAISCFLSGATARFSSANQMWNYLHERDAGEMFYRLGRACVPPGTWMIANSESRPLREYIQILMRICGEDTRADFAPAPAPGLDVNADKTIHATGYKPRISFENGICEIVMKNRENTPPPVKMR